MGLRLLAAATLLVLAVTVAPAAGKPSAAKRLKRFSSCEALVGYAARHVPRAPVRRELPPFTGGPEPSLTAPAEGDAGAGDDSSETNVQEAGVDEPDIVKTDGTTIFTLANG
ncbi:MAG: beta-propeller domain-containing protein, partial [Solirubrobacterales bacterium]|nr:beta-propeller domain-containing protein [Solirubrobacterales bacterium]